MYCWLNDLLSTRAPRFQGQLGACQELVIGGKQVLHWRAVSHPDGGEGRRQVQHSLSSGWTGRGSAEGCSPGTGLDRGPSLACGLECVCDTAGGVPALGEWEAKGRPYPAMSTPPVKPGLSERRGGVAFGKCCPLTSCLWGGKETVYTQPGTRPLP